MTKKFPAAFGPSFKGNYPEEMRRQLWPLCCGASILSGFKNVAQLDEDELVKDIQTLLAADGPVPDAQVYAHETMRPKFTFLTLNSGQMQSAKIMSAIEKAGFVKIGEGKPRGNPQGFFLHDSSKTWTPAVPKVAAG